MIEVLGLNLGIGPSPGSLASDWSNSNVQPGLFKGTLTDLNALVAQQTTQCGTYVKQQSYGLLSAASAANACQQELNNRWIYVRSSLEGHQKDVQYGLDKALLTKLNGPTTNTNIAAAIVVVVVIAIIVILLLK